MGRKQRTIIVLDILLVLGGWTLLFFVYRFLDFQGEIPILITLAIALLTLPALDFAALFQSPPPVSPPLQPKDINVLILLNERDEDVRSWDIGGKNGVIIGLTTKDTAPDIDLAGTEYAAFISPEHAMLNRGTEGWMLQDAGSRNGTRLRKAEGDKDTALPVSGAPIPVDRGDIIIIGGETRIAVC